MQAKFVSGTFSWKRLGRAEVGMEGIGLGGEKQGGKEQRWQKHHILCLEDLCSWQNGVRELTY